MMAYTQENIVSSTQENAENNLGMSSKNCDSRGEVQFCSINCAKVSPLPATQIPKLNVKEKLNKKKMQKKKSKNSKKKEKKKKKKEKQNTLENFDGDECFKETVKGLQLLNLRCRELLLICRSSLTLCRLNEVLCMTIEFLRTSDKECLTKSIKASILKPLLNDIVYLVHMLYSDLRKFNPNNKDRSDYLNKMSDLLAMVIDVEITTSKIYECKICQGKSFKTEVKLKEHLEKVHKMESSSKGWKDDNDINSNIGISEEETEKIVSVLISSLYIYLDNSSNHMIDTMLKTSNKNKKKASNICSRIFSRILQSPQNPMSILEYARHILAFKMWKKMLDSMTRQREVTRLAASLLPAPPALFRERVHVLEGIMPRVPSTKPDSSVTEYCLMVKSVGAVKYDIKDQIQKFLMLINNPQKVTELIKNMTFFGENVNGFDVKDSVFAVDDEDMILYDTFPPEEPTKSSGINKKGTDKKSADRSADKKSTNKKSVEKKIAEKKVKSSVTVDCQTDPKLVDELTDITELVTSSNEEQQPLPIIKIESEIDLCEVADVNGETVSYDQTTDFNQITDSGYETNDNRIACDYHKHPDIHILRKLANDKNFNFDDDADQAKLYEIYKNLKSRFERPSDPLEVMKMDRIGTPEKKTQIVTPFAASSAFGTPNLKSAHNGEETTAQTCSIADQQLDLVKTAASVQDLQEDQDWPLEFFGEMEKYMQNKLAANELDGGLKSTFKEEAVDVISTGLTLKEEEEKRRMEDDILTKLFCEQPGHNEFSSLIDFLVEDLAPINSVEPPLWSNDSNSQPLYSLLMDDELELPDTNDIAVCPDGSFVKDTTPRETMSLEAALSLSLKSSVEQFLQRSPEKRVLARSSDDNEEPQMKRTRSAIDDHNYILTPPSTPVAGEYVKNQVESQKDSSSSGKAQTKNSGTSPKSCFSEVFHNKMNVVIEENASPEKMKCCSENRPSSPLKNVKHSVVDRPKDKASEKPPLPTPPECTCDQRLSGSMIDFYFRYFHRTILNSTNQQKTYIFSVSFYPLLTSDTSLAMKLRKGLAEKRHSQVESITRTVDIFEKDFIIFPIEKHGRWLVVIVCFPGLTGPVEYQQKEQIKKHSSPKKNLTKDENTKGTQIGKARRTRLGCNAAAEKRNSKEIADCDTRSTIKGVCSSKSPTKNAETNQSLDDRTTNDSQPIKQPCILVFDSSPKPRKTEVAEVIRDYLRIEYKVKHGKDKDFSTFMKDSKPKVPTRKNTDSACCGVYMLQYADSFFNNPIVDFRLPFKHLQNWFPADAISRKRDEIYRFGPQPPTGAGTVTSGGGMLHVKSSKAAGDRRNSSDESKPVTMLDSLNPISVLDSLNPISVLEHCNTSDDITDDFEGFDIEQQPMSLNIVRRTADFLNDDDDNARMDVIDTAQVRTPQLYVALSRSDCHQTKKPRGRTRTATALTPKTLPPSAKRKNVCSENLVAPAQQQKTTSKKSEPANKAAKKIRAVPCPNRKRRSTRKRKLLKSSPPKSQFLLRSDDNSTSIPLRTHFCNELWKTIQKMDKKGRRSRK